jgi:hypothetical protein
MDGGDRDEDDICTLSDDSVDTFKVEKDVNGYNASDPFIAIDKVRFTTPDRLPRLKSSSSPAPRPPLDKKKTKRRVTPVFLGLPSNAFSDRKPATEACKGCGERGSVLVYGKHPICEDCIILSVGVPLDHAKFRLIIMLRREVDDIKNTITSLSTARPVTVSELQRRIREIERVILGFVQEDVDLLSI